MPELGGEALCHFIQSYSVGAVVPRSQSRWQAHWFDPSYSLGQINRLQLARIWLGQGCRASESPPKMSNILILCHVCGQTCKIYLIFSGLFPFLWNILGISRSAPGWCGHDRGLGQLSRAQQVRGAGRASRGSQHVDRHRDQSRSLRSLAAEGLGDVGTGRGLVVMKHSVIMTAWWFGCHLDYFPINIGLLIIPTDELIFFQRGWKHQPVMILCDLCDISDISFRSAKFFVDAWWLLAFQNGARFDGRNG